MAGDHGRRDGDRLRAVPSFALAVIDPREELQVRLAAQDIVRRHLLLASSVVEGTPIRVVPDPDLSFWPDVGVNLRGAYLVDLNLDYTQLAWATFDGATFKGKIYCNSTIFEGHASFEAAEFSDDAWFTNAKFMSDVHFVSATFDRRADFNEVEFRGQADFSGMKITEEADFSSAKFYEWVTFRESEFRGDLDFQWAVFHQDVSLAESEVIGHANFLKSTFDEGSILSVLSRFAKTEFTGGVTPNDQGFPPAGFDETLQKALYGRTPEEIAKSGLPLNLVQAVLQEQNRDAPGTDPE